MIFLGNTKDLIDWNSVISDCQQNFKNADKNTVTSVVDRSEAEAKDDNGLLSAYREVIGNWQTAGYKLDQVVWYDYYPGEHFPIEVQDSFSQFINAKPLRVFVSEVWPGVTIPYHWDVEDKEEEWIDKYGQLYRFVCCMDNPNIGAGLFFDKEFLYMNKQGDTFEWSNYKNYHSSANGGDQPSYYFHFLGYKQ
jgi:hypothetical protein